MRLFLFDPNRSGKLRGANLVLLLLLLLPSCTRQSDLQQELDLYLNRLSGTLDTPVVQSDIKPISRFRTRKLEVARVKISMIDFLGLLGCELQYTIGERNSPIGRVATDSQRLLNTLRLLQQAPGCLQSLRQGSNQELADELQSLVEQKRNQLPVLIYNATLAGPEFDALWSLNLPPDYPSNVSSEFIEGLNRLSLFIDSWFSDKPMTDSSQLESTLGLLRAGDAGALLRSLALSAAGLASANAMIEARLDRRPVCLNGSPTDTSRTFERVVERFFIGAIQRRQARLNHRYFEMLEPIRRIETQLQQILPDDYRQWAKSRDRDFARHRSMPRVHVQKIKQLIAPCGSDFGG